MADTTIIDIIIKATNKTKQALREPINDMTDLKGALLGASALWAAAGSAAIAAGAMLAKGALDAGEAALTMSQKYGVSSEAISTMAWAAKQSNTDIEVLGKGMKELNEKAFEAAHGNKQAAAEMNALGIKYRDAAGNILPADDMLKQIANTIAKLPPGAEQTGAAVMAFGKKAGPELLPFLQQGGDAIGALQARARELGLEISGPTAEASDTFKDSLEEVKDQTQGFGNVVMADLLPGLNSMIRGFLDGNAFGLVFTSTMSTLGYVVSRAIKIILWTLTGVEGAINAIATTLAGLLAVGAGFVTGGFAGAKGAWDAFKDDFVKSSEATAKTLDTIWSGAQTAPSPPNPQDHRAALGAVVGAHQEAKIALDTIRFNQLEATKNLSLQEVRDRISCLDQIRFLNEQEAQDYRKLKETEKQINEKKKTEEKKLMDDRISATRTMFGSLISLSSSKNATLVGISKAAAIAQATMDTYMGADKALAAFAAFPPVAFAMAGVIIAAGLANVAMIAGVPGFAAGGVVPGTSYTGDNVLARLNSGEEVFTAEDRRENTRALRGALELASRVLEMSKGGGAPASAGGAATLVVDKRTLGQIIWEGTLDGTIQVHPRALARA